MRWRSVEESGVIAAFPVAQARLKGWSGDALAVAFVAYGLDYLRSLMLAGNLIDCIGALRSLPLALAPMVVGLARLAAFSEAWALFFGTLAGGVLAARVRYAPQWRQI